MLRRKILLSNLSLFESETIFSRKIVSERKKIFLWIYAQRISCNLWFHDQRKLLVAGLKTETPDKNKHVI